jgi:hypothetical protein
MLRRTLLAAVTFATVAVSPALAQGITGTWRIGSSATPDGGSYDGTVTIRPNGECYTVDWELDNGDRYSGIGLNARDVVLAVAYRTGPSTDGYGVIFYATKPSGGIEGWWCQPDGTKSVEDLSGDRLAGTHRLTAGSSTGTVRIEHFGTSPTNYSLSWDTNSGTYEGFGMTTDKTSGIMVGVWGNLEGTGVVLYSLLDLEAGNMPGWWAATNSGGQGLENLER